MRILMFGWEFPPHISGGLGTACFGLTSGLLNQGVDVIFVVPHLSGDETRGKFELLDAGDVEINLNEPLLRTQMERLSYIQVNSGIVPYTNPVSTARQNASQVLPSGIKGGKIRFDFSGFYGKDLMREVAEYAIVSSKIAAEHNFDVIHAHDWLTYTAGIEARISSGKPLAIHVHATEFDRSGETPNPLVYEIERKGMEAADVIISVSHYTKKILVERYGISPLKIHVVHNAAAKRAMQVLPVRAKPGIPKTVTFLGRVTFQKGPDYFIEAAAKVLKKYPDTRFVMAGSGDMLTDMIQKVAEMRISSRFHFTGFLDHEETTQMYNLSDVYVMPSVSEPFGITTLEALQSGVPVIISKQSGVSEVFRNVIKIDFWDTDAIADAICGLLNHRSLSELYVKEGLNEIRNIAWEKSARRLVKIYSTLINRQK